MRQQENPCPALDAALQMHHALLLTACLTHLHAAILRTTPDYPTPRMLILPQTPLPHQNPTSTLPGCLPEVFTPFTPHSPYSNPHFYFSSSFFLHFSLFQQTLLEGDRNPPRLHQPPCLRRGLFGRSLNFRSPEPIFMPV